MRPRGSPEELEKRRERAIDLLDEGLAPVEVARRVGVDRRSVRRWKAAHRQGGRQALQARPNRGRPPKLSPDSRAELESVLLQGARAMGYSSDIWTCRRVVEVIIARFSVTYHPAHVARILRSMGWRPEKVQSRARQEPGLQVWIK